MPGATPTGRLAKRPHSRDERQLVKAVDVTTAFTSRPEDQMGTCIGFAVPLW